MLTNSLVVGEFDWDLADKANCDYRALDCHSSQCDYPQIEITTYAVPLSRKGLPPIGSSLRF